MDLTPTTRRLVARAADQIVRQLSRTTVADLCLTGATIATPWLSIGVRLGNAGGVRYISAALGLKGGHRCVCAPGLIEAIAKRQPDRALRIVERIIEDAVAQAVAEWERAA